MPDEGLERFVIAQAATYDDALAELRGGRKVGHWIWWILPQLRGLGTSETSWRFGLAGIEEARAYLAHSVLGPRLREALEAVLGHADRGPTSVLGADAVKLRSCATLFSLAAPSDPLFRRVLKELFADEADPRTTELVRRATP